MGEYTENVASQLSYLNAAERKRPIEIKALLIANRITKGWAFLGESAESHNKTVEIIKQEVYRQLKQTD